MTEPKPDYRATVFLPKTDFPMKAGLPQKEPGILGRWQAEGLYEQTRAARAGAGKFILHDGPPYANGDIHVGHALNHVLKDMVVRTQTLLGRDAPYVPGWDCHGLPIEWKVEEEYRKKKLNKDEVPPEEFRAECRAYAAKWVDVQREQLKRLGIGGDWDHPYLTMDFASEATIVSELMKFAKSGQLYRGAKPVMWSPVEKTALAEAEIEYEDVVSTQIDVAFEIVECPNVPELQALIDAGEKVEAIIWTTTPWTIPVNQAIAYGPEVEYYLAVYQPRVLAPFIAPDKPGQPLPKPRLVVVAAQLCEGLAQRSGSDFTGIVWRGKGSDLAGTIAHHPLHNLFRHPGEGRGPASSSDGDEGSGTPDQVRGDGDAREASPLPPAGGAGGGPFGDGKDAFAHPNPSHEREGLDPTSPLAEFFLRPRPFLPGDFVTTDAGTGLVHMAPDHGEDDFALCREYGVAPVFAVEGDGRYRADWPWLGGAGSVINPKFNAPDGPICTALREAGGLMAASADYKHSYPHSWRSKAKVIYRCTPQWFVPMDRELPGAGAERTLRQAQGERVLGDGATSSAQSGRVLGQEASTTSARAEPVEAPAPAAERGTTLRQTALAAIADTRFIPDKGRNRIGAMVEGRPDWVLSRQRAWGVPITLFVDRRTGQYLVDAEVNARIVAAIRAGGVDAWSDDRAQEYLGNGYDIADYERVTDILDVWFDSGSTHAFVLESGRWPDLQWPADLYLEGSDQHRGWFQSSLLESCATRGRAPYDAVLTHGFVMDGKGLKMSKSLGNTVSPMKVMEQYGADIIRLWALSVDYAEDCRIGDEILKGVADQYRKLRNTFRYLLGALDGFTEAERIDVAAMPELERYVLALLGRLDATLRQATADFDFNTYVRALIEFCNEDLSAFYFDIRKDSLYCDAPTSDKRRACRTVLDTLFHALVRYAAPVLVFTAEEVWGTRYPDGGSVHLLEWVTLSPFSRDDGNLTEKWKFVRELRSAGLSAFEYLRRDKKIGSSLQTRAWIQASVDTSLPDMSQEDWAEVLISGRVDVGETCWDHSGTAFCSAMYTPPGGDYGYEVFVHADPSTDHKCGRCWRHLPEVTEDGDLCDRCTDVVAELEHGEPAPARSC